MAKYNAEFTPPSATMLTELYYAETDTVAPTQVFGVQGIPEVDTPPDDITYRTLERAVHGAESAGGAKSVLVCKATGQHRRKHARGKIARKKMERRFPHHSVSPGAGRHGQMHVEDLQGYSA